MFFKVDRALSAADPSPPLFEGHITEKCLGPPSYYFNTQMLTAEVKLEEMRTAVLGETQL